MKWAPAEIDKLRSFDGGDLTVTEVAKIVGRSRNSCDLKKRHLGLIFKLGSTANTGLGKARYFYPNKFPRWVHFTNFERADVNLAEQLYQ